MSKPKEFWVLTEDETGPTTRDLDRLCLDYEPDPEEGETFTHVVEMEAYTKLKKALETIRDFTMDSVDKNYLLIQIEGFKKCADNVLKEISGNP